MGIVVIEICDINPIASEDLESFEKKYKDVTVLRSPCLSNCDMCSHSPYAYVNGVLITRETNDQLMLAIDETVQAELEKWK